MASGFIKNKETPTITTGNWNTTGIELTGTVSSDDGHDANSRALPGSASMSHIDFLFTDIDHAATLIFDFRLTYDSAGKDPVLPPLANARTKNARVTDFKQTVIGIGARYFFTAPSTQTASGSLYAFVNPTIDGDSDTDVKVDTIRAHWNDKV
jgi:hypothetical protein